MGTDIEIYRLKFVTSIFLASFLFQDASAIQFVSLKSSKINMRVGPGEEFPVSWVFIRAGLPVKLIAEFQHWRKIKCHDNTEGWIHQSMISGRNTAIIIKDKALLYEKNSPKYPKARISKDVIVRVLKVEDQWAKVDINKIKGWMKTEDLWGTNKEKKEIG
ncbi:MAG: hypothetical protein E7015_01565 [Alphaproteobacteria bacterium]|nr:hypothetical protein [Alphaproteobacteria bacterium]